MSAMLTIGKYRINSLRSLLLKIAVLIVMAICVSTDTIYAQVMEGFVKKKDENGNYYLRIYKEEEKDRSHEWRWYIYNATKDGSYGETLRVSPNGLMVKDVRIFRVPDFYWSARREIIYVGKTKDNKFILLLKEQYRDGRNSKNVRTNSNREKFEYSLKDKSTIVDIRDWEIKPIRLEGEDLIYSLEGKYK